MRPPRSGATDIPAFLLKSRAPSAPAPGPDKAALGPDLAAREDEDYRLRMRRLIGEQLRARREYLGVPRARLARLLGVSVPTFGHYETGHTPLTADALALLAHSLRVPVGYFYGEAAPEVSEQDRDALRWLSEMPAPVAAAVRAGLKATHDTLARQTLEAVLGAKPHGPEAKEGQ